MHYTTSSKCEHSTGRLGLGHYEKYMYDYHYLNYDGNSNICFEEVQNSSKLVLILSKTSAHIHRTICKYASRYRYYCGNYHNNRGITIIN